MGFNKSCLGRTTELSVVSFGAKGDGSTDDINAIMAAVTAVINQGGGTVFFPAGTYNISSPIVINSGVNLIGVGKQNCIIHKTTTTAGPSVTRTSPTEAAADSMNVDAIVILDHDNSDTAHKIRIENLKLTGLAGTTAYGIYAPSASELSIKNVWIMFCNIGYWSKVSWMWNLQDVRIEHGLQGIVLPNGTNGSSTSLFAQNVYITDCVNGGWYCFGLAYSSLNACDVDETTGDYSYKFLACHGLVMNGCGAEGLIGAIYSYGSQITVNGFSCVGANGNSGYYGMVYIDGSSTPSKVNFNNCNFPNWTTPLNSVNFIAQGTGNVVVFNNTILPTNGDTQNLFDTATAVFIDAAGIRFKTANNQGVALTPGSNVTVNGTLGRVFTLTPGQACNINATANTGTLGQEMIVIITTSGTTSYNVTFNTGFKSVGVLATGAVSGKTFVVKFIFNGTTWHEVSRTAAM